MPTIKPQNFNPTNGMVAGQWYEVKTSNSNFVFWVERRLERWELRDVALDYLGRPYDMEDIDSVRKIKNPNR